MLNVHFLRYTKVRFFSAKTDIKLDDAINTLLDNNLLKHRNHPGIISRFIEIPKWITSSVQTVLQDASTPTKVLYEGGQKLSQHLQGRNITTEQRNLREESKRSNADNMDKYDDELNIKSYSRQRPREKHIYKSGAIQYDRETSLYYLAGRSLYDYCVLCNVLNQIKTNDSSFTPKTLFDFGSGVGTVMWAVSQLWPGALQEYFAVDPSSEMNKLSAELAERNIHPITGIFYRQFFPAVSMPSYDIVISSFSLLDLPNMKARFDVVQKLWSKTQKYLIIIEEGTNAGFTAVNEARDIVLYNINSKSDDNKNFAHVLAPCPHDMQCPRYATDNTPCNFEISYYTLPLSGPSIMRRERFSYVILKKGIRSKDDKQWPRIVRPTLKRSKHVICRTCTATGKLEEFIFTSYKYGKNVYRCARVSKWGDLLPIETNKDK